MEGEDPLVTQCRVRVGRMIGNKWRLDALIGVGGMAAVYMATHRNGSMSAVKILHEEVGLNAEVRERFLREAYIANKVNHPGTVKVLDDDKDEAGVPYIVMELLQGESVDARAQKAGGRLTINEALDVLDQTLAVLEAAHKQSIVHRDLKPENLFMVGSSLKVLDFGIARLREDQNSKRTQTGMVMGTPSFMAPEQAMGRWNDVDARTDLWAMGATTFTLLTGLAVHEAETAGEMLVAAATRPARSLARVLNNAPFPLVALVDRSLAYDRENRFPDATAFRQELAKVRASLSDEAIARSVISPHAPIVPPTVHGKTAPEPLYAPSDDDDERERVETFDPSSNTDEEIDRMTKFFTLLERALTATKQYSKDHPEPKRRFEEAFRELSSALMTCDIALAWNLTPYSFGAKERVIWEPEAPWNRIPYQLFSDGVRMMGLAPGLEEHEFFNWLRLISIDPTTDLAPEDDVVTMLWDANFDHVFFQAIDSFAEGNQDQRARYEADRLKVLNGAHVDHKRGLTEAWQADHKGGKPNKAANGDAVAKSRDVFHLINRYDAVDAESAARVANMNLLEESPDEAEASKALALDESTQALLAARLEVDVGATSERFVVAAAHAFIASAKMGRSNAVTAPLRRAVDSLGSGDPSKAIDMILELREAVLIDGDEAETTALRATITTDVLSPATLLEILRGSAKIETDRKDEYLKATARVLGCIEAQHFDSVLAFLPEAPEGPVQDVLIDYITRMGRGNELKIAGMFTAAKVDLGLALVRMLAAIDTPEAKEAVALASRSPHALVRIEALGHVEGVSGPRLRTEMRKLVEDENPDVRLLALRAMEQHNITIAGPFLVLRIQEKDFIKLPFEERRQALQTLCKLRPKRGEEVCMALLADSRLLRSSSLEETREIAAGFLAEVATSNPAFFLLEGIAESSAWRNSKRVREAAAAGVKRLKERAEESEKRRAERKTMAGSKSVAKKRKSVTGATGPGKTDPGATDPRSTDAGNTRTNPSVSGVKTATDPGDSSQAEGRDSHPPRRSEVRSGT